MNKLESRSCFTDFHNDRPHVVGGNMVILSALVDKKNLYDYFPNFRTIPNGSILCSPRRKFLLIIS